MGTTRLLIDPELMAFMEESSALCGRLISVASMVVANGTVDRLPADDAAEFRAVLQGIAENEAKLRRLTITKGRAHACRPGEDRAGENQAPARG